MVESVAAVRLAAAASTALQQLLTGPRQSGTLLGTSSHAAWIGIGDEVIVLSDRAAVRLPNGVELAVDEVGRWIHTDDAVSIGDGIITIGQLQAVARRWFDPRPSLGRCRFEALQANLARLGRRTLVPVDQELLGAFRSRSPERMLDRSMELLGLGRGLTPEGDDIIAGAIASHLLLAGAVGQTINHFDGFIEPLLEFSRTRTTSFSASLIRHAAAGRVSTPFARVLEAVTGRGNLELATDRLLAVGHSSGAALVAGILVGGLALSLEHVS